MKTCTTIRAAIYARVSSQRQSQDKTIQSQLEALRSRVRDDGLLLDPNGEFIDDGVSGSTLIRPALDRLRDQSAAGELDRLYVLAPDRLARRYAYQVLLIDELQNCDVEVVFLNRQINQGPEDDLLLQVQGVVAEYERAKILERSRRGKLHAARRGSVSVLTTAPYGYRYLARHVAGGEARLNVQLDEARIIRDMFHWVAVERLSISEVARRLKNKGILSPKKRDYWDRTTVHGILRNPCYKGLAAYGKRQIVARQPRLRPVRNQAEQPRRAVSWKRMPSEQWISIPVPAIVDADVFDAVQEQLSENKKRHRCACANAKYLLQGLVMCKCCGFAMCGARNGKRMYYRCIGNKARRMTDLHVCQSRSIRGEALEEAVWRDVQQLLADPKRIELEYQRRLNLGKSSQKPETDKLQKQARQTQAQIERLIDAYGEGLIDKKEFDPRVRATRDRLKRLEADIQSESKQHEQTKEMRLVIGHLQTFAEQLNGRLVDVNATDQREIVTALIKRVEIDAQEVKIVYRFDCFPFVKAPHTGVVQDCRRRASRALSSA